MPMEYRFQGRRLCRRRTVNKKNGSVCFDSDGATYTTASWQIRCINGIPIVKNPLRAVNETTNGTTNATAPPASRRALLSTLRSETATPAQSRDCARHVDVDENVIHYRENPTKGIWILLTEAGRRAELLEQLSAVTVEDKAFWLFSHGLFSHDLEEDDRFLYEIVDAASD
ncbi:hypothetical protein Mapa_001045 [Marchantia paleacea]|nr:hypothetical protein Mapa_001045 [Marchantia paleacea]